MSKCQHANIATILPNYFTFALVKKAVDSAVTVTDIMSGPRVDFITTLL